MAQEPAYDYRAVKNFAISALVWGVLGSITGTVISRQLVWADLNFGPWFSYGRLRPLHTNVNIYGFTIAACFSLFFYLVQRLTRTTLAFPGIARAMVYIFNAAIVLAGLSLLAGMNQSKEYSELEWPLDIGVVILWVLFAIVIIGTILKRKEEQMYVSLWYMLATVVGVAIVYIGNNLSVPVGLFKSYSVYAGANDANVQWWFGHNAVAFVFTTIPLAVFYYILPKSTNAPLYSHRLSIVGFWSLVFAYLWTGAHHLIYTPLPDWIQTVAIAFSIFLIAPSWASVINGYGTMTGQWEQMRTNYLAKFIILGITFYGLQTLQGPSQAIRAFSALVHYTDWVPGHVHMGTMGWVTMTISAGFYYMVPKIYKTELHSIKLANAHFWLVLIGQLIFSVTMWITGIRQGAMWQATAADGSLMYSNFIQTLTPNYPFWIMRAAGGVVFFAGFVVFVYNLYMTVKKAKKG
jgi:cytochrome c oxidase cbb3-type subunit 1